MRMHPAFAAILISSFAVSAGAAIHGAWTATADGERQGYIEMNMTRKQSSWGNDMDVATLTGLTIAQIRSSSAAPVSFDLRRDAGVVHFEGTFRNGDGAGQFDFTANRDYLTTLRSLHVDLTSDHDDDEESSLYRLAMHDVSAQFIRDMQSLGYKGPIDMYVRFRIHGVTPAIVRDFNGLGFKLDAEDLVRSQIHGATPQYVRDMRAAGFSGLSMEELVRSRIHGATPEFIRAMSDRGYANLPMDTYVRFRIHGVTPEFVDALRPLGYTKIDSDDLVRMRIHDVTPEYIREMQSAGYKNVAVDELVRMRIHGVDADFARRANGH
jgi:hypothetical protein